MKILLIIPFFGSTPGWVNYFLKSCSLNPDIEWLLYGNLIIDVTKYKNIKLVCATLDEFNILASRKLGFTVKIEKPYKICDFKPAFGDIFSEYIRGYDFWGYCDIDLIFGKIKNFITSSHLSQYDVITTESEYMSGHFTLFKNNITSINYYKKIWQYKRIFEDKNRIYYIDEKSNLIGLKLDTDKFKKSAIFYLIGRIKNSIKFRILKKLPYSFDITQVLKNDKGLRGIKILHLKEIQLDTSYLEQNIKNWQVHWDNGILTDRSDDRQLMYFHFMKSKYKKDFVIQPYKNQKEFTISEDGIYS